MLSLPDIFCLVAGVSRRNLCVVFGAYPLGRVGDRGAAGNRGAYELNSGLPTVRRKLHQRLGLHPKRAVPTQRRTDSRGLVSLYAGQSGGVLGSVAFLVAFVGTTLVAGRVLGHDRHRPCPGARGARVGRGRAAGVSHVWQLSVVRPVLPGLALVRGQCCGSVRIRAGSPYCSWSGRFWRSSRFPSPSSLSAWRWPGWA